MNNLKINNLVGLHLYKLITKIINYGVDHMIYISCKPTSLARDLEVLLARGYVVDKVQCVDMFPNTVHVETGRTTQKGYVEILEFTHFVEFFSFNRIAENHKEKELVRKVTVVVALDLDCGNTKNSEYESK